MKRGGVLVFINRYSSTMNLMEVGHCSSSIMSPNTASVPPPLKGPAGYCALYLSWLLWTSMLVPIHVSVMTMHSCHGKRVFFKTFRFIPLVFKHFAVVVVCAN